MANNYNQDQKKLTILSIEEALIFLMLSKSFDSIGISELCIKAGVSRMAFYRHFQSKLDVLKSHLSNQQKSFMASFPADLQINHRIIGYEYLTMVKGEKRFFKAIFNANLQWILLDHLEKGMDMYNRGSGPDALTDIREKEYLRSYDAGGFLALITRWLNRDCEESIDVILDILLMRRIHEHT